MRATLLAVRRLSEPVSTTRSLITTRSPAEGPSRLITIFTFGITFNGNFAVRPLRIMRMALASGIGRLCSNRILRRKNRSKGHPRLGATGLSPPYSV
jgi:hypothetical protein